MFALCVRLYKRSKGGSGAGLSRRKLAAGGDINNGSSGSGSGARIGRGNGDSGGGADSNLISFTAGTVMGDFEKLIISGSKVPEHFTFHFMTKILFDTFFVRHLFLKDANLRRDLRCMLVSLENIGLIKIYSGGLRAHGALGPDDITDETALFLSVPPIEATLLFENKQLKLADKIRRVVTEPMNPLLGDNLNGDHSIEML